MQPLLDSNDAFKHAVVNPARSEACIYWAGKRPLLCQCLQELARLAKKRAFLREVTAGVLLSALEPLSAGDVGDILGDAPAVVEFMAGSAEEGGPEVQPLLVRHWACQQFSGCIWSYVTRCKAQAMAAWHLTDIPAGWGIPRSHRLCWVSCRVTLEVPSP